MFKKKIQLLLLFVCVCWSLTDASGQSGKSTPSEPRAGDVAPLIKLHRRKPDPQPLPQEISEQLSRFFSTIMEGKREKIESAYGALFKGTRLAVNPSNIPLLTQRTLDAISALGAIFEYEHFDTQNIGSRIIVATYLAWHEFRPLIWRFTYFRLREGWTLADVRTDDDLESLIE
jgi:hypothetical protein